MIGTVWIGHEISSETDLCFASCEIHVCSCMFGNCTFAIKIIPTFKVVICGKYKNLNKITIIKYISLKFHRLLIFVILYSLQCKIEGHAV